MPVKALTFKPGVNRENTQYTNEATWYDTDKVRFRQGLPEKIGGWVRISTNTFQGVCRSLHAWVTLSGAKLVAVGTELKYYIMQGGQYYDVTPVRTTDTLGSNPFATVSGDSTVTVTHVAHGATNDTYVSFSGASAVAGLTIAGEYRLTFVNDDTYTIDAGSAASSTTTGGGASVAAEYRINAGYAINNPVVGYGAGPYGYGPYGVGVSGNTDVRQWSQAKFGEDLVFTARNDGGIYFWDASVGAASRAVRLEDVSGASGVPTDVNYVVASDINRYMFALGCNPLGVSVRDDLLIRWCDQENLLQWTPQETNSSGSLRLDYGSLIVTAQQARQELLVWTDTALYNLQFVGGSDGWGAQLLGSNISIASQNSAIFSGGRAFWMGRDNFYTYDGAVQVLRCDVKKYVFSGLNREQLPQIISGHNEGFGEIWWFYPSSGSTTVDKYVVYNYQQDIWYFGNLARTAWLDSNVFTLPLACTYGGKVLYHESGIDDDADGAGAPIEAHATTTAVDLEDGDSFIFIRKVLPDVTFVGATAASPSVDLTFYAMEGAGSGRISPTSAGGDSSGTVVRSASAPVEAFTDQLNLRLRGRHIAMKVSSSAAGVAWQLGKVRVDMKPDGRRG